MVISGGRAVSLSEPKPCDFDPELVAPGLSHEHRYAGSYGPYSVAQHSVLVAETVERLGGTLRERLAGLVHDNTEAVLGDLPSPVKSLCPDFRKLERLLEGAINERYGVDVNSEIVKEADRIVFAAEVRWLVPREHHHLYMPYGDPGYRVDMQPEGTEFVFWSADEARKTYLTLHETLVGKL